MLDALVTSSKRGGVIAALGKVLYNNGLIFLFREDLFSPQCMLFSFLPGFLSLAVDGLFCIHADYVASLFHLVN